MEYTNILYKNDKKLKELGISNDRTIREVVLTLLIKYINVQIDFNLPKKTIASIISRLRKENIPEYYGTISSASTEKAALQEYYFQNNDGEMFILDRDASSSLSERYSGKIVFSSNIYMLALPDVEIVSGGSRKRTLEPILIALLKASPDICVSVAPVGVSGLTQLLFPNDTKSPGFELPNDDKVVPKIVIIKGAPGTGKTTMAVQMMVSMAKHKIQCAYWCSNDTNKAISQMAVTYDFCNALEIKNLPLTISQIEDNYFWSVTEEGDLEKSLEGTNVLFFDSLNVSQIENAERGKLWRIFRKFKTLNTLVFFLLEDYGNDGSEYARQLIADCEFLADVVIELDEGNKLDYETRHIRVAKKHYGEHTFGTHIYKICQAVHPTSNLYADDPSFKGIIVYPSIHHYLSMSRQAKSGGNKKISVHTGITHLDSILSGGSLNNNRKVFDGKCIPENSCIVISGPKGMHKLAIGLNMLLGGLWNFQVNKAEPNKDVLVIQLAEETYIDMTHVAMAKRTDIFMQFESGLGSFDNGKWMRLRTSCSDTCDKPQSNQDKCLNLELLKQDNSGKKVQLNKWCFDILDDKQRPTGQCRKVVVAGFRPGCITPEEFISCITKIMTSENNVAFSRVLFVSTAHLRSGFPLLYAEPLLLRALTDSFKANGLVSIFLDVQGAGSDKELSYGLESMADYHIKVTPLNNLKKEIHIVLPEDDNRKQKAQDVVNEWRQIKRGLVWGRLDVENVRGKDYSHSVHGITVVPSHDDMEKTTNELFLCDIDAPYISTLNLETKPTTQIDENSSIPVENVKTEKSQKAKSSDIQPLTSS